MPVLRTAFAAFANAHAKASIARAGSVWNSFCTFLVTDGVLAGNPMSGVTRPRTAKRTPKPLRGDDTPERLLTAHWPTVPARSETPGRSGTSRSSSPCSSPASGPASC